MKYVALLSCLVLMGFTLMSSTPMPQGVGQPVIPRISPFKGDIFKNFAEYRVQNSTFNEKGIITLYGEPFIMLVNCNSVVKIHRFEDSKKTDYSCLMFIAEDKHPRGVNAMLVREKYEDVLRKMKRAIESR